MSLKIEKTKLSDFKLRTLNTKCYCPYPYLAINTRGVLYKSISSDRHQITGYVNDDFVYAVHSQKFRKKTSQVKDRDNNTTSTIIRNGMWVYTVYRFPINRVKFFKQHERYFEVVLY